MTLEKICNYNKYGKCKFGRNCNYKHEDKKCKKSACDVKTCILRHPDYCRYVVRNMVCKFGEFCAFEHDVPQHVILGGYQPHEDYNLKELHQKIEILNKLVRGKNEMIQELSEKVKEMETRKDALNQLDGFIDEDDLTCSGTESNLEFFEENPSSNVAETDFSDDIMEEENDIQDFKCSLCDFKTLKKSGLRIHFGKKHKDQDCRPILNQENDGYVCNQTCGDCLGIFDLKLNNECIIFMHSQDCWSFLNPCSDFSIDIPDNNDPVEDSRGKLHTLSSTAVNQRLLDWDHLYRLIVGYNLGSLGQKFLKK